MSNEDTFRLARNAPQLTMRDHEAQIDMGRMRKYRLNRAQNELKRIGCDAAILFDPINIRYTTGTSCHPIFNFHVPSRYVVIPAEGKAALFETGGLEHSAEGIETLAEVRTARPINFFFSGPRLEEQTRKWAAEIGDLLRGITGNTRGKLALDRAEPSAASALQNLGFTIVNAQGALEYARSIKSPDEIACMTVAISIGEMGMARMRENLKPGITENELWSHLHQTNIAHGGEWIEARLLSSGGNINPWGKECCDKIIRAGELVAFDTDMVGPLGYCVDVSRTFFCKPGKPTAEQRRLYQTAAEQLTHNLNLIRAGRSFREFSEMAWKIPDEFLKNRYAVLAHGIGLCDEYPAIAHHVDWQAVGFDGEIKEGMTLCLESFIGSETGVEGVKLEEQVLVTANAYQQLSTFPYEDELLN
jgi:Xaa-Pro dipeptidase